MAKPNLAFGGQAKEGAASTEDELLRQYAETWRFRLGHPARIEVAGDGRTILFLRSGPRDFTRALYAYSPETGIERVVATAERLAGGEDVAVSAEEKARRERLRLAASGIADYVLSVDGSLAAVALGPQVFLIDVVTGTSRRVGQGDAPAIDVRFSPDGAWLSVVRAGVLQVIDLDTGQEHAVSPPAAEGTTWATAEFVAQEEMGRMEGYWWSPDSQWLAFQHNDERDVETLWIGDPADPARPPQPWRYPRVGRSNAVVRLGVAPRSPGGPPATPIWIDWDRTESPYVTTVRWQRGAPLTVVVQSRDQRTVRVLVADPTSGATHELHVERDPLWINLDQSFPLWLEGGSRWLWATERTGAWQVEMRDAEGALVQTYLDPAHPWFRRMLGVRGDRLWLTGEHDATREAVGWLSLSEAGPGPIATPFVVASEPGVAAAYFHEQSPWIVHELQSAQGLPRWTVHRLEPEGWGPPIGTLTSVAEEPLVAPRVEWRRTARGEFAAAVVRPLSFDPSQRYPVLLYVYGGPHAQMVRQIAYLYVLPQWFADRGYVVVSIDGRGTPGRGREWERAIAGRFAEVPLADQVEGLRALGEELPELDLDRVGIYGWSFGGYTAALAAATYGDFFRAAIAGAPVTEWLDYDTHYTERYLGIPHDGAGRATYAANGVVGRAAQVSCPLLLIHGTADDNVYFTHSLKLAAALFEAGAAFTMVPLPGQTHGVTEPGAVQRLYTRIAGFLHQHVGHGPSGTSP